jgi:hypothetical protein
MGVCLMGVYLTSVHLMGVYLINVHIIGVLPQAFIRQACTSRQWYPLVSLKSGPDGRARVSF